MRAGGFPSREEVLHAALARGRTSRRAFVLGALWGVVAGAGASGGWWLLAGGGGAAPPRATDDPELRWARRLAVGPMAELREQSILFLATVDSHPRDAVLRRGVLRLALHAIRSEEPGDRQLAYRLLGTVRSEAFRDSFVGDLEPHLRSRLR